MHRVRRLLPFAVLAAFVGFAAPGHAQTIIDDLRWRPISTSTSVIHKARGSADPMRTPTVC